ncbi:hypothetical protein SO802_026214 [Lithocarpus litseifolius]|uniref:SWIM-type domain-containing protein n=1 Tax=Lithocarpus litseifolius TaxID=425828 RepID=A0AAW2C2A3_9ROSI
MPPGTSENFDDDGLGDDATNIDVTKVDLKELLDTMGEHEDVDYIEDVVVEKNRDTCTGHDPTPEWFKHCRPMISIDATHLYGKYKGKLIIAMATNANNKIYPLAFAVIESESTETWGWFLACIRKYVTSRSKLCVISDRHPGIQAIFKDTNRDFLQTPMTEHRYCLRHDVPKEKWALAFDEGFRYGTMTTNVCECFNGVLKGARSLPITAMAKAEHYRVMRLSAQQQSYQVDTPHNPGTAGHGDHTHGVNLLQRTCTCHKWKLYKIPCSHVIAVCIRYRQDAEQYIDQCYSMNALFHNYAPVFPALKDRLA